MTKDEDDKRSYVTLASEIARKCDNCDTDQPIGSELWVDREGWHLCPKCWMVFYDYEVDRDDIPSSKIRFKSIMTDSGHKWIEVSGKEEFVDLEASVAFIFQKYVGIVDEAYQPVISTIRKMQRELQQDKIDSFIDECEKKYKLPHLSQYSRRMMRYMANHLFNDMRFTGSILIPPNNFFKSDPLARIETLYSKASIWTDDDVIHCFEMQAFQRGKHIYG